MGAYYARVCWNTNGWRFPSGDAAKAEQYSYAAKNGFGHEEWLFNFSWIFNGYRYAFLQPVNDSLRRLRGQMISVWLWAIRPDRTRVQVGKIENCEVLTTKQASEALDYYRTHGWLREMGDDVARVKGVQSELGGEALFNIRFRRRDAVIYDDLPSFSRIPGTLAKFGRYKLVKAEDASSATNRSYRNSTGTFSIIDTSRQITRRALAEVTFDPQHQRLQARLMTLLQGQFGKRNVKREGGWGNARADLVVKDGSRLLLIEIKPYASARQTIREALGQVLDYAFCQSDARCLTRFDDLHLFIVAPAEIDRATSSYLTLLQSRFHIPISYCSFTLADNLPRAFCRP